MNIPQQETSPAIHLKYYIDSTQAGQGFLKNTRKKKVNKDVRNISGKESVSSLKTYSLPGSDSLKSQIADSQLLQSVKLREFRFSDIDTIRAESTGEPAGSGPGLFSGHQLSPVHSGPITFNRPNPDWLTFILFGIIFGFMWIWVFYQKILRQIINAFFNTSVANQIVRDENILIQRASVMLSIMFYLVAALFTYQMSMAYNWQSDWLTNGFSRLIIFAFFIAFAYSAKMILLKMLGYVLDIDKQVATYIFNIFLMNNILGLILLPVVIIIAYVALPYTDLVFQITLLAIAGTFLYRLIRGFRIGMTIPKFSIFYLFLYLCAFEIAPLAIIYKIAAG